MSAALRYEWRRITTVRSPWICLVLAAVAGAGIAWLGSSAFSSGAGDLSRSEWVQTFLLPLMVADVLALVTGAQAIGQEYRFGMIRLTLTSFPRRLPLLAAKALVVAAWCVGIFAASVLGSWLVLAVRGQPVPSAGLPGGMTGLVVRAVLVLVGWAAFGFALAGISRLTAIGITLPLVWGLIGESILSALLLFSLHLEWVADVLPFRGATAAAGLGPSEGQLIAAQSPWAGLGVFWAWAAGLLVLCALLFERRDA